MTHLNRPWCWEDWRQEEKGTTEDEIIGWHHWLNGHEFEQAPGAGDRHGGLVCCSPWSCKELDTTERLNNNALFPPGIGHCLSSVYLLYISWSIISLPSWEALAAPLLPPEAHLFKEVSATAPGSWEEFSASRSKNVCFCILFKEMEAQKDEDTCPRSQSLDVADLAI